MNESTLKDLANEQMPLNTAISGFINRTNYINLGIISEVHDENYVDVKLYYVDSTGKEMIIPAVRLLHVGTTKCKLNITPAVGDNVLLLCPKDFIEKLEYNKKPNKSGVCYLPYGNMNMCGVLVKDEADDNVKTTIKIDEEGTISVETEGDVNLQCKGDANAESNGDFLISSDKTVCFDGDSFGGLCKTLELKKQLNILTGRLDAVINGLENAPTAAQDGGATYKAGITTIIESYTQKEDFSQIENTKVKHGDNSSS